MKSGEVTLLLGLDAHHLGELRRTWPTWQRHKPDLLELPTVVFYDSRQVHPEHAPFLRAHRELRWVPWDLPPARNQREKMISGFLHVAAREVRTPWHLKLDTDVIATADGPWRWNELAKMTEGMDSLAEAPVFLAPRWGYTAPRYALDLLDDWADTIPALSAFPRLNIPYDRTSPRVWSKRVSSWFFLAQTAWVQETTRWLDPGGRLPVPSHDTFLYYCAARQQRRFVRLNMNDSEWQHRLPPKPTIPTPDIARLHVSSTTPRLISSARNSGVSKGVVYFNAGTSCLVRLLVSLWSLRRWYQGPVSIFSIGKASHSHCEEIGEALNAEVWDWEPGISPGENDAVLAKTLLPRVTPYETSLVLDSDTLIRGSIDELLETAQQSGFVATRMADWTTTTPRIAARIRAWRQVAPTAVRAALRDQPAINAGVVAFRRDASLLAEWPALAVAGRKNFIPDEISCQLLLPQHPHNLMDARWNCSCRYGPADAPETRIVHYHGRRHCRPGYPFHGRLWVDAFDQVTRDNIAGIRRWLPAGDNVVERFLKWRSAPGSRPFDAPQIISATTPQAPF